MEVTLEQLTRDVLSLSLEKRAALAHALILSIDEAEDEGVSEAWDAELEKRVAEIRQGRVNGIPAGEVFAKLREKHG